MITPQELKNQFPCKETDSYRAVIKNILSGVDGRLLLIVGPCSIHDLASALEYGKRLAALSKEVEDVFFIAMRTYFEKPRTQIGWKGLLYDPYLDGSQNLEEGLIASRKLLCMLRELNMPCATEFLEPLSYTYLEECISWGSIGARTCQSPVHRQLASALKMPVGFKNRCDGDVDIAIQACLTAKEPHSFLSINNEGKIALEKSAGNPDVHIVLRGSHTKPNYTKASIDEVSLKLKLHNMLQAIVVDCSHGNSGKQFYNQLEVFRNVIAQKLDGASVIKGLMLESFLLAGASKQPNSIGQSLTDPCLDWQTTEQIILQAANMLRQKELSCV